VGGLGAGLRRGARGAAAGYGGGADGGVRGGGAAVAPAAGRAGAAAGGGVRGAHVVAGRAERAAVAVLGRVRRRAGVVRGGAGGAAGGGGAAAGAVVADDARVPAAVGGVPVGGERGAAVLRVRLGVVAVRGDVPRGVAGLVGRGRRSPAAGAAGGAVVLVPGRAGCGADQAARGPGVAGPDGAGLPPRDAAAARRSEEHTSEL